MVCGRPIKVIIFCSGLSCLVGCAGHARARPPQQPVQGLVALIRRAGHWSFSAAGLAVLEPGAAER